MIRAASAALWLSAAGALACQMPQTGRPLSAVTPDAPLAYAVIDTPPVSAPFVLTLAFCSLTQGATSLDFDAVMPAHQHGMNFSVDVTQTAKDRFEVSNIVFHMPGLWQIRVDAELDGKTHTYTTEVTLE